jgi:hypothetical protein
MWWLNSFCCVCAHTFSFFVTFNTFFSIPIITDQLIITSYEHYCVLCVKELNSDMIYAANPCLINQFSRIFSLNEIQFIIVYVDYIFMVWDKLSFSANLHIWMWIFKLCADDKKNISSIVRSSTTAWRSIRELSVNKKKNRRFVNENRGK